MKLGLFAKQPRLKNGGFLQYPPEAIKRITIGGKVT